MVSGTSNKPGIWIEMTLVKGRYLLLSLFPPPHKLGSADLRCVKDLKVTNPSEDPGAGGTEQFPAWQRHPRKLGVTALPRAFALISRGTQGKKGHLNTLPAVPDT